MQTKVQKKIEDFESPLEKDRAAKSRTLSKNQRRRMHKIKKL
jgi:hypothetical protein